MMKRTVTIKGPVSAQSMFPYIPKKKYVYVYKQALMNKQRDFFVACLCVHLVLENAFSVSYLK